MSDKTENSTTHSLPIKRQAIVVVHGQGEQRPMGTIRDFVETLWTFDFGLKLQDPKLHHETKGNRSWIVPDEKGGLFDIQRITCPELEDGRRTDFFELYYADILNSTPLRTLSRWLQRLLWIDPRDVTERMRWPWTAFWFLAFGAFVLLGFVGFSARYILEFDWVGEVYNPDVRPGVYLALAALGILVVPRLTPIFGFLAAIPVWLVGLVGFVGVAYIFGKYGSFWIASGLVIEIVMAFKFLLPYFGDAASYLSAHTETVESRQMVRSRGLALLKALHNDPEYDRIVVVAHSLGSVLAYDLLHILWGQVGPLKSNPPSQAAVAALKAVDVFVEGHGAFDWDEDEVTQYQELQWIALNELRQQKPTGTGVNNKHNGWKISDFVTLGSPLTSAQFIMADGAADFECLKTDRVMPTAPAQDYNSKFRTLYPYRGQKLASHHGAVFSTVRWTNVFDPFNPVFFILGDPIGGPISGPKLFGEGVNDVPQIIQRGGLFSRLFTHNHYWTNTSHDWRQPSDHIRTLRDAVDIDRRAP